MALINATRLGSAIAATVIAAAIGGVAKPVFAQASAPMTAEEKANVKVIQDFIAAWNAKDGKKVMSFFAEDARFSVGEIGKTGAGGAGAAGPFTKPDFGGMIAGAKSVSMVITPGTTWARGPVVTHERVDKIVLGNGREISGKYIAVFTLRNGKIVDFIDFDFCPGLKPECR
jgi:ketosteroid isomerase-like protein